MIKLEIEPYCHGCPDFEAEVGKSYIGLGSGDECYTYINCEHRSLCDRLYDHINKNKEKEND